ncbi:unnamed protein product [Microthlaspi erraticum]|uniref:Uncharacterized protein n=1 Tax=Microthlaspi erraticum TaxID=1685480 RepID=A0A6D2KBX9_9BRAS|nr:unnamed protein product [Microthlaspi erraticum]
MWSSVFLYYNTRCSHHATQEATTRGMPRDYRTASVACARVVLGWASSSSSLTTQGGRTLVTRGLSELSIYMSGNYAAGNLLKLDFKNYSQTGYMTAVYRAFIRNQTVRRLMDQTIYAIWSGSTYTNGTVLSAHDVRIALGEVRVTRNG